MADAILTYDTNEEIKLTVCDGGRVGGVFCGPYAVTGGEDPATDAVQVARDEAERGRRGGGRFDLSCC